METAQTQFYIQPTADGFDTLYSAAYGQTYHSKHGALLEAEHVFLNGSGVSQRLADGRSTRILEVGFGTGLNFLLTACRAKNTAIHYTALEKTLLPGQILARLNHKQLLPEASQIHRVFLGWRDSLPDPPPNSVLACQFGENIQLELILGDAAEQEIPRHQYHAIYHDAFSPNANPELWTQEFFARLRDVLAPGGKLATYSVQGTVRRNLQAVGFTVQKLPGPPGKREMLVATR